MSRRLLPLVALALLVSLSTGCADDVAPAARVGDAIEISNHDLLSEVEAWAGSPALLGALEIPGTEGLGAGSYATQFVDDVLSFRIRFELHNAQFEALGLELTDEELAEVRSGLFGGAAASAAVLEELGQEHGDVLVADAARQFAVSEAMADGYEDWQNKTFASTDVEVNPRYGSWDSRSGTVVPPDGPRPAPSSDPFTQP